jgi:ABC-type multidrug transport system fused ATPase/permease subunit
MIKSEEQSTGSIPWKIYSFYFSSGGASKVIISLFIFFLAQGVRQLCDWWLGMWSEDKFNMQPGEYIGIFAGLMVAASILFWVRFVIFSIVTTTASKHIFQKLVDKIMKAPLAWVILFRYHSLISLHWGESSPDAPRTLMM